MLKCAGFALSLTFAHQSGGQTIGGCATPQVTNVFAPAGVSRVAEHESCPVLSASSPVSGARRLAPDEDPSCGPVVGAFTLIGAGQGGTLGFSGAVVFDGIVALASSSHRFRLFTRDQALVAAIGTSSFAVGAPLGAFVGCSDRKAHGIPILRDLDSGTTCPQRRSLDLLGGGALAAGLALGLVASFEFSFSDEAAGKVGGAHVWRDAGRAMIPTVPAGVAVGNVVWSRCLLARFSRRH